MTRVALTGLQYRERCAELDAAITEKRRQYEAAALKAFENEGYRAEAVQVGADVVALEEQRAALDAAWRGAASRQKAAQVDDYLAARRDDHATAEALASEIATLVTEGDAGVVQLRGIFERVGAAIRELNSVVGPYADTAPSGSILRSPTRIRMVVDDDELERLLATIVAAKRGESFDVALLSRDGSMAPAVLERLERLRQHICEALTAAVVQAAVVQT